MYNHDIELSFHGFQAAKALRDTRVICTGRQQKLALQATYSGLGSYITVTCMEVIFYLVCAEHPEDLFHSALKVVDSNI